MAKYFKKEERKKQIKEVAIKLMATKGYMNTTVQDILDDMRYSKSGFYNCYASKKDLFREILEDGIQYRNEKVLEYKNNSTLDRKSFMIEALLDKIVDYNKYKNIFYTLMKEMKNNDEFINLYSEISSVFTAHFVDFCKKEGFEEYLKINTVEFGYFLSSLMVGVDIFDIYDDKKYKDMLRNIITAYFDKINLFDE